MLMKYKQWIGDEKDAWNNSENDAEIISLYETFLKSFGNNPPNFLQQVLETVENVREQEEPRVYQDGTVT